MKTERRTNRPDIPFNVLLHVSAEFILGQSIEQSQQQQVALELKATRLVWNSLQQTIEGLEQIERDENLLQQIQAAVNLKQQIVAVDNWQAEMNASAKQDMAELHLSIATLHMQEVTRRLEYKLAMFQQGQSSVIENSEAIEQQEFQTHLAMMTQKIELTCRNQAQLNLTAYQGIDHLRQQLACLQGNETGPPRQEQQLQLIQGLSQRLAGGNLSATTLGNSGHPKVRKQASAGNTTKLSCAVLKLVEVN